jgi:dihydroorotase
MRCPAGLFVLSLAVANAVRAEPPRYDLLLKGGHVIDPANGRDALLDVGVANKKIAAVQKDIPATQAGTIVDVRGLYVTPGLVDIHVHVGHGGAPLDWFTPQSRSQATPLGVPADLALQSGVTTVVDAGTAGAETFLLEKEEVLDRAKVRVLAFLNIVANGMQGGLEQSPDQMDVKKCAETIQKYPDLIVGVKTAHYWSDKPWDAAHAPWTAVDRAEECGRAVARPVMVDFWPRPPERSYEQLILEKMRPGDIHTHVFARQFPIVREDGTLNPALEQARKRGVVFDVGHGAGSFWFRNAVPAVAQGFVPDSLSTDLHVENYNVLSLANVMSKFLAMGVPVAEVVRRATVNPAREIGRPDLGTLSVGSEADVAVLEVGTGPASYADCGYARLDGYGRITARLTVRAGRILYDPSGLSMVPWTKARPQYQRRPEGLEHKPSTADDFPRE